MKVYLRYLFYLFISQQKKLKLFFIFFNKKHLFNF